MKLKCYNKYSFRELIVLIIFYNIISIDSNNLNCICLNGCIYNTNVYLLK